MTIQEKQALAQNALNLVEFVLRHCENEEAIEDAKGIFREKFACLFTDNFVPC